MMTASSYPGVAGGGPSVPDEFVALEVAARAALAAAGRADEWDARTRAAVLAWVAKHKDQVALVEGRVLNAERAAGTWALAGDRDLATFASHVDGHSASRNILEPGSIREMTTASVANAGYAKGWAVNPVPNWWHGGALPGTTSIMVRTASGFCWAALANGREASGDTGGAMDRMMWDLVRRVSHWKA